MKNSDQPAFANNIYKEFAADFKDGFGVMDGINPTGVTKREYFAIRALQGILSNPAHNHPDLMGVNGTREIGFIAANSACIEAVRYADELLNQLQK